MVENARPVWQSVTIGLVSIAAVYAAGRWLLNPMFGLLARFGAREVMTAAARLAHECFGGLSVFGGRASYGGLGRPKRNPWATSHR